MLAVTTGPVSMRRRFSGPECRAETFESLRIGVAHGQDSGRAYRIVKRELRHAADEIPAGSIVGVVALVDERSRDRSLPALGRWRPCSANVPDRVSRHAGPVDAPQTPEFRRVVGAPSLASVVSRPSTGH